MPRRMSCSLTVDQVKARTKTETRRHVDTWKNLRPGDELILVEKAMGLPKGAHQKIIGLVIVTENVVERLYDITDAGVVAEGFPDMTPGEFCAFWADSHGVTFHTQTEAMAYEVRVIRWRYLADVARDIESTHGKARNQ